MEKVIVVRGAGDVATGIIYTLHKAGYKVIALDVEKPTAIRRQVAFSSVITAENGKFTVQDVTAELAHACDLEDVWQRGNVPVLIDEKAEIVAKRYPDVIVDAILAKKNLGTDRQKYLRIYRENGREVPLVIGVGPGFNAGQDVDCVIETMREHGLGEVIYEGSAYPNTGIPGNVGGFTAERVIHAPAEGMLRIVKDLGQAVDAGEEIARIYPDLNNNQVYETVNAKISGFVRGMIPDGFYVTKGLKIADVDPRMEEQKNYNKITDKALKIGEGVLKAIHDGTELR